MLSHLHIKNFAIIDDVELELQPGMTVLTGETGAGKSIIIDAIELALGQRANSQIVGKQADRAHINLIFDITNNAKAQHWLKENELHSDDHECLIQIGRAHV